MGNPFTMMDEYHQRYWQNYRRLESSRSSRGMSDHQKHLSTHYETQRTEDAKYRSRKE